MAGSRVDLHGNGTRRRRPFGIQARREIALHDPYPEAIDEERKNAFDQRSLSGPRGGQDVQREDAGLVEPGTIRARDEVVGFGDLFDHLNALGHDRDLLRGIELSRDQLHVDGLQATVVTRNDVHLLRAARRTFETLAAPLEDDTAFPALELQRDSAKVKACPFGGSIPADDLPVKLDTVTGDAGEVSDHQMDVGDPTGSYPGSVVENDVEQTLGDR
jgi:hypothetical protein